MRMSAPAARTWKKSACEPGTRSISPKEQKITSERRAMAWARSMVSSGVTQTGQPGPCASSISPGSRRSSPYFTMEWVWPPQTSMRTQGRETVRQISSSSLRASAASRYSSRCFIEVSHVGEELEGAGGLVGVYFGDREAGMDQDVVAELCLGQVLEASLAGHTTEIHLGHTDAVRI